MRFDYQETLVTIRNFLYSPDNLSVIVIFKIKTVNQQDDYSMLREVLIRRLDHPEDTFPDLIMIDGGKGQLNVASEVIKESGLNIALISLAKEKLIKSRKGENKVVERFFIPGRKNPVILHETSLTFRKLVLLRDEAHRFAHKHNQIQRKAKALHSGLDDIKGVGPVNKKKLLSYFKTFDAIKAATLSEIIKAGLSERSALKVLAYFENKRTVF